MVVDVCGSSLRMKGTRKRNKRDLRYKSTIIIGCEMTLGLYLLIEEYKYKQGPLSIIESRSFPFYSNDFHSRNVLLETLDTSIPSKTIALYSAASLKLHCFFMLFYKLPRIFSYLFCKQGYLIYVRIMFCLYLLFFPQITLNVRSSHYPITIPTVSSTFQHLRSDKNHSKKNSICPFYIYRPILYLGV